VQFIMERICEHKEQMFGDFRRHDPDMTGYVSKAMWGEVMMSQLGPNNPQGSCQWLTREVLALLVQRWELPNSIGYMRFLHRFQIRGQEESDKAPDIMREVSRLRRQLLDTPSASLERLLDPNGDRTVSSSEFATLMAQFGVDVASLMAAVLYESMATFMEQDPLTLDSCISCLSIMSRDPPPVNQWSNVAEWIGEQIRRANTSYAHVFRFWDTDRDGYLSLQELQDGLPQLPGAANGISPNDVKSFMSYIESMGVDNDRISMFEFVRAVAPRELSMQLHQTMVKDLLKRVWICRPALKALVARFDPHATNKVTVEEFRSCMDEINAQLQKRGRPALTSVQLCAICEIASGGCRKVEYDRFIRGLHIVDIGRAS